MQLRYKGLQHADSGKVQFGPENSLRCESKPRLDGKLWEEAASQEKGLTTVGVYYFM